MLRHVLVAAATAALTALAAPSPRPPASSRLVVVPRAAPHSAHSVPACATLHATVGARTLLDLYHVPRECLHAADGPAATRFRADDDDSLVSLDVPHDWLLSEQRLLSDGEAPDGSDLAGALVWLHPVAVDSSPSTAAPSSASDQLLFSAPGPDLDPALDLDLDSVRLPFNEGHLVRLPTSVPSALSFLSRLSSDPLFARLSPVVLSRRPLPLLPETAAEADPRFPPMPDRAVRRVKQHLDGLRFDPLLSTLLAEMDRGKALKKLRRDVRTLSGEDQHGVEEDKRWKSRHSMSEGGYRASDWVYAQMQSYGFTCTQLSYLPSFAPMVECVYDESGLGDEYLMTAPAINDEIRYDANETVILSAHFDSRGSFGYTTAPGADDDASGTALVLAVARQIYEHRLRFARKLVLCLFSGEEQGLLSSSFYARRLVDADEGANVALMLQVDMVGFRKPGEPMQLARPDLIGLGEVADLVGNLSSVYTPELVVGYTPACCSDHQSFATLGLPSSWIFERNGPIADPCYHNSCDVSDRAGYDFEQIAAHAKVAMATVWEVAGGAVP
ncbi:uncharacterized protein JCM10292_005098 [Rhodotorula paludigena]|uniref:uncharacterized protein n=1 Tax=Rhodotorula paludigena TaxID=86838 RepID=UPI00317D68BD